MIINNKNAEIIQENNMMKISKGTIFAIIITLTGLLLLSILLAYTNISESVIVPAIIIITAISILLGSMFSSIKIKKQGIINGAIVGSIYIVTLYILSSIFSQNFTISTNTIIMIITGILAGAIGGVIGVNLRYKKRDAL